MRFDDWFERTRPPGMAISDYAEEIAGKAGVSKTLILNVRSGMAIKVYVKAESISRVTEGRVTIRDLCGALGATGLGK